MFYYYFMSVLLAILTSGLAHYRLYKISYKEYTIGLSDIIVVLIPVINICNAIGVLLFLIFDDVIVFKIKGKDNR